MSFVLLLAVLAGGWLFITDCFYADETAIAVLSSNETESVIVSKKENMTVFLPRDGSDIGIIFYPGARVEYTAYAPLLYRCAEQGITCVLIEMPGNLAFMDMNAADGITDRYTHVNTWYLAGHSLGGAMAASYLANHTDSYEGIV